MTTSTLSKSSSILFSAGTIASGHAPKMEFKKDETSGTQVLVISDVPVFRTGTFRDSMGFQTTWEPLHIDQMVSHFEILRNRRLFEDVPVRDGHEAFFVSAGGSHADGAVIGYHTNLRAEVRTSLHDGKEYTYLIADLEIIDPKAQEAIRTGLWRNLSAEVGPYITNDEAEFWPVYSGVAYVDRPAVEGLKAFSKEASDTHLFMEEGSMTNSTITVPAVPATPALPEAKAGAGDQEFKAPAFVFTIAGKETSDFAAVQAHIKGLEEQNEVYRIASEEQETNARTEFVNHLSQSNRILASSIDSTLEFAKSLSAEQFSAWKSTMEQTPAVPVLGVYSAGEPNAPTPTGGAGAGSTEADTLRAVIREHQRAHMPAETIKGTKTYKSLKALDPNFEL